VDPLTLGPDAAAPEAAGQLEAWLIRWTTATFGAPAGAVGPDTAFDELGMDSTTAITLVAELEAMTLLALEPAMAWEHRTIRALSQEVSRRWTARETS
jgi:mycocerosic acid synthase